ncbi:MAG: cobalamin biosynthesis protein CobQ [Pseudomonadota bacterium]
MNTPAHLILAAAIYAEPGQNRRNAAALAGGFAPDLSLYLLVAGALAAGYSPRTVFGTLYDSAAWQAVFAVDNSVFVWGAGLAAALAFRAPAAAVFCGAALLHIALDLPLHHDDGRPHFWPLTTWVFESPVSYWDPRAHGRLVGALESAGCLLLLALLWRRFPGRAARMALALAAVALAAPMILFGFMFG